jgi:predicted ATPase
LECTEERWYETEIHRIRAEVLLKRDLADTAAAEQSLQAAIAMAQSQKARSFEARRREPRPAIVRPRPPRRSPRPSRSCVWLVH